MREGLGSIALLACLSATTAHAWDPFIRENPEVDEGNRAMQEGDHAGALAAYDRAARELPSEPGVHLNRGLALSAQGELERAREAFLVAAEPPASPEVRADAYYDMGNAFYREADAVAQQEDHQGAQRLFREAADAYRRSLRAKPGNRDAAWNLELAMRRIREQEEEQRQQEEEQRQQQAQNEQQQQDQQQQDQQQQDQQQQDQQQQDQQQQAQNDQQQQDDQQQQQQDGQEQQDDQQGDDQHADAQDQQDPSQDPQQQPGGESGEPTQGEPTGGAEHIPEHVARVLDSLQESEENLERFRAHARGRRENRRVTKDW
jgi:Ca-activated chloride channel family protein